jgi:hypothetical protein
VVAAQENWAFLEGEVRDIRSSRARNHLLVGIAVDRVEPDNGWPNLLSEQLNTVVHVTVPEATVQTMKVQPGVRLHVRAQKASPFDVVADRTAVTVVDRSDGGDH